ncbi:MAG: hypothetical protein M1826_005945 [Phylliscum demangeonii]|nr:MAG: hypothetical protein M1826_005945 [Phylliscum demangeonii]
MLALLPTQLLVGSWIALSTTILTTTTSAAPAPAVLYRREEYRASPPPEGDGSSSLSTVAAAFAGSVVGSTLTQLAIHKGLQWRQAHSPAAAAPAPALNARTPAAVGARGAQGQGQGRGGQGGQTELPVGEGPTGQRGRVDVDRAWVPPPPFPPEPERDAIKAGKKQASTRALRNHRPGSGAPTGPLEPANAASRRQGLTAETWLEQMFGMKVGNDDEEGKAIERCIRLRHDLEDDTRTRGYVGIWLTNDRKYNNCRGPRWADVAATSKWAPAEIIHHWKTIGHQHNAFSLLDPVRREASQLTTQAEHAAHRVQKWAAVAHAGPAWSKWEAGARRAAHPVPLPAWEY